MSKPRLLLADDSLTIQKLINLTFTDEGFDVVTVGDGDAALREIGTVQPAIVLADVHMPGPNGYEICQLMRGIEETATTPVMLLVGSFEPFDNEEAERVGANAFVTKPFQSIRTLVDQVNGLLYAQTATEPLAESEQDIPEVEVSENKVVDTSDIDSLYEQSFGETVETPVEMTTAMEAEVYEVDGLDDEMIETSYVSEQELAPIEFAVTPIDDEKFDEVIVSDYVEESEPTHVVESPIVQEEDVFEPVYDDIPAPTNDTEIAEMQTAETEEFRHEALDPFATTAQEFDLDEIDLLDLTPANMTETIEFTTPALAVEQGSKSQVVSLSPELLDIIVQRVVEKLSEKY